MLNRSVWLYTNISTHTNIFRPARTLAPYFPKVKGYYDPWEEAAGAVREITATVG